MKDFIAVLVLYQTSLQQSATFISITKGLKNSGQHLNLVVYDNTPGYNAGLTNGDLLMEEIGVTITYKADAANGGVSKAYNFGAAEEKPEEKNGYCCWIRIRSSRKAR
jgi:hypothetical protein